MSQRSISDGREVIDVGIDPSEQELESLRAENRRLQRAVADAELEARRAREDADRALSNLRRQLGPLYRALQMVFGELDAAGVTDVATAPVSSTTTSQPGGRSAHELAVWESWKTRLGGAAAKCIDALLLQREMSARALAMAIGTSRLQTIYDAVSKMNKAGILTKNGDNYTLRDLA